MKLFSYIGKKLEQLCSRSWLFRYTRFHLSGNQLPLELFYFLFISSIGFFILHSLHSKTTTTFTPRNLDLFFTSVSAATVSSMSTVEMEVFSNTQLVILTTLMVFGGEVFTSMVIFHLRHRFFLKESSINDGCKVDPRMCYLDSHSTCLDEIELHTITIRESGSLKYTEDLKDTSFKFLGRVVFFYLVFVQLLGVVLVLIYLNVISSAKNILREKGLHALTFSVFTVTSTFSSCGFVPTNENMIVFRKNSGLLLILIPQVLLGNTLYPPALRFFIWSIGKFTKKPEARYVLNNSKLMGYRHLLSYPYSSLLVVSVFVFIMVQFVLFSSMEWSSGSLGDLDVYQKLVGILFQSVNTRHTGETIVDLSTINASVLVLFVVMMYLPPYTSFVPVTEESYEEGSKRSSKVMDNLIFSQLSYLAIFIIIVCITERKHIVQDPLNFNVLNIVVEVISAYGNVGFSTGYNCDRRLKIDEGRGGPLISRAWCQKKKWALSL